jgi:predicted nucleotidyltransferase
MSILDRYSHDITQACVNHKVAKLYAFGSVLTNQFTPQSDIDLVVEFNTMPLEQYADNYYDLKFSLEKILNRSVDLLEEKAIRNPYFRQELQSKQKLVYGD